VATALSAADVIPEEVPLSAADVTPEEQKRIRPSDPFKQGLAGLSDAFISGPPLVAGFLGAAGETVADYFLDDNDKTFFETFGEAISTGVDKDLLDFGARLRIGTNELLGIKEAASLEDQAARLLTSLVVPVPAGFLGGAAAKGIGGFAGKAATFILPTVRRGPKGFDKVFATRAGIQAGLGGGIDQGIRALMEQEGRPTIFSEEAISGAIPSQDTLEDDLQFPQAENFGSRTEDVGITVAPEDNIVLTGMNAKSADTLPADAVTPEVPEVMLLSPSDVIPEVAPTGVPPSRPIPALQEQLKAVEEEETSNFVRNAALFSLAAVGVFLGARFNAKLIAGKTSTVSGLDQASRTSALGDALREVKSGAVEAVKKRSVKMGKDVAGEAKTLLSGGFARGKSRIFGTAMDKTRHSEDHLRNTGSDQKTIDQITGQEIVDPFGVVEQFLKDGKFGQGSAAAVRSLKSIKREYDRLNEVQKQEFTDGMAFAREDVVRTRATIFDALEKDTEGALGNLRRRFTGLDDEGKLITDSKGRLIGPASVDELNLVLKEQEALIANIRGTDIRQRPGLFNRNADDTRSFIEDPELRAGLQKFNSNSQFVSMQRDLAKINNAVLAEAARRGTFSKQYAAAMGKQFTINGKTLYLPGKENLSRAAWYKRLATNLGFHTSEGKKLNGVANWHLQGLVEGKGIQSPLDPFQATAHYALQVMEHTNRSVQQWNILTRLTGIIVDENGNFLRRIQPEIAQGFKPTRYVGSSSLDDPLNQGGQIHIKFNKDDPNIVTELGLGEKGTFTPQQLAKLDDVLWVQRGSTYHGFLVADRQLKKSLEFDAGLHNRVLKFANFWKNLFTKFTTGNLSPFGITSFIYNQQISTANALLRASKGGTLGSASKEAIQTWTDSFRGAYEFFTTRLAEDYVDLLGQALSNRKLYGANPEAIRKIQEALKRRVAKSMLGPMQRETGRSASGLGSSEFQGSMTSIMEEAIPHISNRYGANVLPQFWRIWNHFNTSMHEGTALGISMRKSHEALLKTGKGATPAAKANISRQARRDANDLVGDVRLRGSSDTGKAFHAITPFSGAMLQAWSTLGRSLSKAPGGTLGGLAILTTAVGIPTVLEVAYNNLLDDEEGFRDATGRVWNYREYFWKGFTVDQRINNHIIFKPGRPPWEAVLIPVTPELSMFRAFVIDAMEVTMGLSEAGIEDGNHFLASLKRIFDIPLNPFLAMVGTGAGLDLRAGIIPDDTEGKGFSFFSSRPIFTGQGRISGQSARVKFEGDEFDKQVHGMIQDIFGSGGAAAIGFYEGFNAGNERTSIGVRTGAAFDSLGRNIKRASRFPSSLFSQVVRPTPDRDVARDLLGKKDVLQMWKGRLELQQTGGAFSGGRPTIGDAMSPTADPIAMMLADKAGGYLDRIKDIDVIISNLRINIKRTGNTTMWFNRPVTVKQREELIDAMNLRIGAFQAQQLSELKKMEEEFAADIFNATGKDLGAFEFNQFEAGPTPPHLVGRGLPRRPQTSQ
jgi:hypothetical protein